MKLDNSFLNHLESFLSTSISQDKIISIFATGGIVHNQLTSLSDIDIVIIGKRDNNIFQLRELQGQFREFFRSNLRVDPIFFADPSFERTFFINNPAPPCPLVHLIYHPIDRFSCYVRGKNPILFLWKKKYTLLFGEDLLYNLDIDPKQATAQLLIGFVDDLLQMVHNLFLVTEIDRHYQHYVKTFSYCCKRLVDYLSYGFLDIIPIKHNALRQKYTKTLEEIDQPSIDKNRLVNLLAVLENDLTSIKNHLLEKQKNTSQIRQALSNG